MNIVASLLFVITIPFSQLPADAPSIQALPALSVSVEAMAY